VVQLAGFGCNVWVKVVRERIPAQLVPIALPEMVYERIRQGARPTMPPDSRERLAAVYETQWRGLLTKVVITVYPESHSRQLS
jgi:hypothetical protein